MSSLQTRPAKPFNKQTFDHQYRGEYISKKNTLTGMSSVSFNAFGRESQSMGFVSLILQLLDKLFFAHEYFICAEIQTNIQTNKQTFDHQ